MLIYINNDTVADAEARLLKRKLPTGLYYYLTEFACNNKPD